MSINYERSAIEGLTDADMVKSLSAKYGPPTKYVEDLKLNPDERQDSADKLIAQWEDAQFSFNLIRSSFPTGFGLIIYSKSLNADAEIAMVEAAKLEEQQGPQKEADRQKKVADDLEAARQKNLKSFRP